jgi:hypothetical protein
VEKILAYSGDAVHFSFGTQTDITLIGSYMTIGLKVAQKTINNAGIILPGIINEIVEAHEEIVSMAIFFGELHQNARLEKAHHPLIFAPSSSSPLPSTLAHVAFSHKYSTVGVLGF